MLFIVYQILNSKAPESWNWAAINAVINVFVVVVAFIAISNTNKENKKRIDFDNQNITAENENKRSLFYLEKIKEYFDKTTSLLIEGNNNIKWHQAIALLETTEHLKDKLKDESHKSIYLFDFINTGYEIVDIVKKINDFRFFYGVTDYKTKDSKKLYEENSTLKNCRRIDPEKLQYLCAFIEKVEKTNADMNKKNFDLNTTYNQEYFKKSIKDKSSTLFTLPENIMKTVYEYIKDYKEHELSYLKSFNS